MCIWKIQLQCLLRMNILYIWMHEYIICIYTIYNKIYIIYLIHMDSLINATDRSSEITLCCVYRYLCISALSRQITPIMDPALSPPWLASNRSCFLVRIVCVCVLCYLVEYVFVAGAFTFRIALVSSLWSRVSSSRVFCSNKNSFCVLAKSYF